MQLAIDSINTDLGTDAAGLLLSVKGDELAWNVLNGKDTAQAKALLCIISGVGSKESIDMMQTVALSAKYPMNIRKDAASNIGNSWSGEDRVLEILKAKKVPTDLIPDVVASVSWCMAWFCASEAESYLPGHAAVALRKAPTIKEFAALKADATKGKTFSRIFAPFATWWERRKQFWP